jgi:radical SAM superfamily enzyme YgiQ (UPF0313 family)
MMLSILVCHSYFLHLDAKQWARAKPYPPLATLQAAAMLRKAGHRVAFFDAMLADGVADFHRCLEHEQPQVVVLYEDTFNFLTKMCLGTMRRAALEMIALSRRAGARVIAGGPDVSDAPAPYLRAGADVALKGEGLAALLEVLPRLDADPDARAGDLIEGLVGVVALRDGKEVSINGAPVLPVAAYEVSAAWDLVEMERYRAVWLEAHGYFSLNMAASRGCSFRCAWCAKPTWGNQYLQRNPREVAFEMAHLKSAYRPDHIWFTDDIFGFRVDWITEFAAAAESAAGIVPCTVQTRADLISERMAQALARAGCVEAWIGAESGSQKVLDAMNKGTTVNEIRLARDRLKDVRIRVGFFIQLGYMGEEIEDIVATRELLRAARPDEIGVSVSYPLPGTKFYELVKAQLGRKTHWNDSNDLDMMFQGTYTSDFYRAVRDVLHDQVALLRNAHCDEPRGGAAGALERRWQELLVCEARYRARSAAALR